MAHHVLKTDPEVFQKSWDGDKPWEIRRNDRGFKKSDTLTLRETKFSGQEMKSGKPLSYTGREIECEVKLVVDSCSGAYGLSDNWVVMTVEETALKFN